MSRQDRPSAARIAGLLEARDMRAEDLAVGLTVSFSTVARWLNGSRQPSLNAARRLGEFFDVDWREFYADPSDRSVV